MKPKEKAVDIKEIIKDIKLKEGWRYCINGYTFYIGFKQEINKL